MKGTTYNLDFRRKRKGLTDYRKRLRILSSNRPRLVIRKSLKGIQASIVTYGEKGDIVKASVHSSRLKGFGWDYNPANLPAAYLVGYLLGKKAKKAKLDNAVADIGLHKSVKGSKIYAVIAGAVDAGLDIPHKKEVLPSKDRILGAHIAKYAESLKKDGALLEKRFGAYVKNNADPGNISKKMEEVKGRIDNG